MFSLGAVAPLVIMMLTGALTRAIGLLDEKGARLLNRLVFRVFLPILLCKNVMESELNSGGGKALLIGAAGVCAAFLLLFLIVPRLSQDDARRGVIIQGCGRSNYALYGLTLITSMYPGENAAVASLMIAVCVPLFNVFSIVALASYGGKKKSILEIVRTVLLNPLLIASMLGLLLLALQVKLPGILSRAVGQLSGVATPLALFSLGASIRLRDMRGYEKDLFLVCAVKLMLLPAVMTSVAALCGLREMELACVFTAFAAPTAVSSFPMAQEMNGDATLAALIVAGTTVLSVPTVFLMLWLLRALALL